MYGDRTVPCSIQCQNWTCRRTDYLKWVEGRYSGHPVDQNFFLHCMAQFRWEGVALDSEFLVTQKFWVLRRILSILPNTQNLLRNSEHLGLGCTFAILMDGGKKKKIVRKNEKKKNYSKIYETSQGQFFLEFVKRISVSRMRNIYQTRCSQGYVINWLIHSLRRDIFKNQALAGQNHDLGINLNKNCPKGIHS